MSLSPTRAFTASLAVILLLLALAGCGGAPFQPVKTQTLVFKPDKQINDGQLLPVDIIYVSYLHQLRELSSIGPSQWFNSSKRAAWLPKQSVGVVGGKQVKVKLDPVLTARCPFVVIFASFKGVANDARQQVIIDYQGYAEETILVHAHTLQPTNQDLKDLF